MRCRAVRVAEHLEFHVAWPLDQSLEIDLGVIEAARGHRARALDRLEQLRFVARREHADAPSAAGGLHEERKSDFPGRREYRVRLCRQHVRTSTYRHSMARGEFPCFRLVPHGG